jgi:hypothetical protein
MTRQGRRLIVRTAMAAAVALLALNRSPLAQDAAKEPVYPPG